MSTKLVLKIDKNGRITSEWWTKDLANMFCRICQKCKGWKTEERPIDCLNANRWCG
jgi:hypothetical protein